MTPPFLRDLGFQRNKPEHWPRRKRQGRRKQLFGSNDQQGTYHQGNPAQSLIPDQTQPRCPTRGLDRYRKIHANPQTPERPFYMEYGQQNIHYGSSLGINRNKNPEDLPQANEFSRAKGRKKRLESHQEFQAL
ncbi:hypothetical protein O181_122908 [Austropuccinia psidii MF-1]|uniref:Uncharacterized protein n=1 Tax=Austropuccinia psidii MF-1 TaxID=1389203 RepID=A0A9Q3KKR4_9BASI|nr:hypothetical protein [Austropuccinia psidii MF-1]